MTHDTSTRSTISREPPEKSYDTLMQFNFVVLMGLAIGAMVAFSDGAANQTTGSFTAFWVLMGMFTQLSMGIGIIGWIKTRAQ